MAGTIATIQARDHATHLEPGDVLRIVGSNGSGKTTILRQLAGLPTPWSKPLVTMHREMRPEMLFQEPREGLIGLTVAGEARMRRRPLSSALPPAQESATLSQGEAARLALDLASGDLLLIDETPQFLDGARRVQLRELVERTRRRGAVVVIDHTGALEDQCSHTLILDEATSFRPAPLPEQNGIELRVPAFSLDIGRGLSFPRFEAGPGVHLLYGANGSGKTTWLRAVAGLQGDVACTWRGIRPEAGKHLRMLMPGLHSHVHGDHVDEMLAGCDPAIQDMLVPYALGDRHPSTLSGGQLRRVSLAAVLGHPAPIYLLDEPEAHLDTAGRQALQEVLARRVGEGSIVIAASHDVHWRNTADTASRWAT